MIGAKGLRNFVENINPLIHKMHEGKEISKDEMEQVVQFYQEVRHVLSINLDKE